MTDYDILRLITSRRLWCYLTINGNQITLLLRSFFSFNFPQINLILIGRTAILVVAVPFVSISVLIGIISFLQRKAPHLLPNFMRNWKWLPLWARSLEPTDRLISRLVCCLRTRTDVTGVENPTFQWLCNIELVFLSSIVQFLCVNYLLVDSKHVFSGGIWSCGLIEQLCSRLLYPKVSRHYLDRT